MATTNSGSTATETFGTTSAVTGAAPTAVDGTDGQPVADYSAIRIVLSCATTLGGAGTLNCYVFDPAVGGWARELDLDLTVDATTQRQSWTKEIHCPRSAYIKWVPAGVDFAGGGSAGVTVYQLGFSERSRGQHRGV